MPEIHKLRLDDFETEEDCVVIGINSNQPSCSLCWHLNKYGGFNFTRIDDVIVESFNKKITQEPINLFTNTQHEIDSKIIKSMHGTYRFENEEMFSEYYLFENKGTLSYIEPKMREVDYFIEIIGKESEKAAEIVRLINSFQNIGFAFISNIDSLINKHHLFV
ncbi:MAG: IPExxxVDY family protein [Bacteroidia bacterium]|nr:IPExxxVDY family protein [Bacteroidia bacterium]MCZ2249016.1 IPExxxVDY family protein [Bacteroidia bacterium]